MAYGAIMGQTPSQQPVDAQDVTYSGTAAGSNVKEALDNLESDTSNLQSNITSLKNKDSQLQQSINSLSSQIGNSAQVQLVSYVGNGQYGSTNPCSITASFPIKVAISLGAMWAWDVEGKMNIENPVMIASTLTTSFTGNRGFCTSTNNLASYGKKSYDGRTFSWYSTNDGAQLNTNNYTYYFLCFG